MICRLLEIIELLDEVQYWLEHWPKWHDAGMAGRLTYLSAGLDVLGDKESGDVAARAADKALSIPIRAIHNIDAESALGRMMK